VEQILTEYRAWMESWGASERTIKARVTMARGRLNDWGLGGFTQENVQTFLARPRRMADGTERPMSQWTRSTYHTHIAEFCAWLVATDRLVESPMPDVRKPKRPTGIPRPLTERDVERVMSVAVGRTRTWIMLALYAGLRASEVAKIRGEDVAADGIYVLGKGNKPEVLPCHDALWAIAQGYPREGYWFPGSDDGHVPGQQVSLIVGRMFHGMGIDGSIHRARHTYGTRLLREGVNIRTVQKLMRHANLNTTANYTAVDEHELRAAINRLSA
jgi:integrase/recombinase XerD